MWERSDAGALYARRCSSRARGSRRRWLWRNRRWLDGEPVVTVTAGGDTTISGKVKPGAFGKFVHPVATLTAGRQYTFRYTPSFPRLSQPRAKHAIADFKTWIGI